MLSNHSMIFIDNQSQVIALITQSVRVIDDTTLFAKPGPNPS